MYLVKRLDLSSFPPEAAIRRKERSNSEKAKIYELSIYTMQRDISETEWKRQNKTTRKITPDSSSWYIWLHFFFNRELVYFDAVSKNKKKKKKKKKKKNRKVGVSITYVSGVCNIKSLPPRRDTRVIPCFHLNIRLR